jgi:hypothetical protein
MIEGAARLIPRLGYQRYHPSLFMKLQIRKILKERGLEVGTPEWKTDIVRLKKDIIKYLRR